VAGLRPEVRRSRMAVITSSSAPNTVRFQAVIVGMGVDVDRVLPRSVRRSDRGTPVPR